MSYIGNPPVVQATRLVTEVEATQGQTTFLPAGGYTVGYLDVEVNGVTLASADFTATDGVSVVLSQGCGAGDVVRIVALGTFTMADAYTREQADAAFVEKTSETGAALMPVGTTAQRPASPQAGETRYNTTTGTFETYDGSGWQPFDEFAHTNIQAFTSSGSFTVPAGVRRLQVLVVAGGGGGGGYYYAGGGGAGGLIFDRDYKVTPGQVITATVGAGGASQSGAGVVGNNGSNSTFGPLKAIGGGGGGTANYNFGDGAAGGSGGGCGGSPNGTSQCRGGSGVNGQGSSGGNQNTGNISIQAGGGGGGAGMAGLNVVNATGALQLANGGDGLYIPLFSAYGASGYFAGGGGGSYNANSLSNNSQASGGLGGGGLGGGWSGAGLQPTAGAANTGGGGGGAMHIGNSTGTGAAGGSGVILVAWYQ